MAYGSLTNRLYGHIFQNRTQISLAFGRWLSSEIPIAKYEEIKVLSKNATKKLLVDVREPKELNETGRIPNSINIPLATVGEALSENTNDEQFQKKFGCKKPDKDTEVIFYCKIGVRSLKAAQEAQQLGFSNVKNYKGSWTEWAEKENLPK